MELKIYQNYFQEDQKPFLDPAFIPYDNTENLFPYLHEYPVLKKLQRSHIDDDIYWGVMSWRWREKIVLPGSYFIDFVRDNPGYDLYHCNKHQPDAKHQKNVFIHGEKHHKGMRDYIIKLGKLMKWDIDIDSQFDPKYFITCSFYVMHSKMWNKWITFLDECLVISYNDESLSTYLNFAERKYRGNLPINFPFIVERLIAIFCLIEQLKVIEYFNMNPQYMPQGRP